MEKILIADDEQLMRQLVIDFLKPEGYEILEAVDGKEALDIYDKEHPDLVLLDVMMPGYDGWTVCREIRRESTVPIMMLTAKGKKSINSLPTISELTNTLPSLSAQKSWLPR